MSDKVDTSLHAHHPLLSKMAHLVCVTCLAQSYRARVAYLQSAVSTTWGSQGVTPISTARSGINGEDGLSDTHEWAYAPETSEEGSKYEF